MVLHSEWAQVEVIDLMNDGSGLAFGIIGGRSTGVIVKTILPGGVADRDGRLKSGDHILQIGEVNLRGLGSEQVASVLRQCGVHVRMVVARPADSSLLMTATANGGVLEDQTTLHRTQSNPCTFAVVPTRVLGDPVELDRYLVAIGCTEVFSSGIPPYVYADHHEGIRILSDNMETAGRYIPVPLMTGAVIHEMPINLFQDSNLPESEKYVVELTKDNLGLGITVAGYVCETEEISGIFVKSVSKGSAADLTKNIQNNDRIIEVNGISVLGMTNHAAVTLLRQSGPNVKLTLERYLRGPKYERLQQAIRANEMRPPSPPSPTLTSLPKVPLSQAQMGYLSIEPDDPSRTSFEFDSTVLLEGDLTPVNEEKEIVIGNEKRSVQFFIQDQDFIYDRWKDRVKVDAEIVIARMHKSENSGLGISLEGTVDVENGKELRPHHYIRNILPDGPVGKDGTLQSADELLEVNGVQLMGLNHLNVVSILKQLPNVVCLVCARHATPIQIIDTSQHKEAFQARKILAGSLHTLLASSDSRHHLEKAKSQSSLVSSNGDEYASNDIQNRSRSLDLIGETPLWKEEATIVKLEKTDKGLGFSILDYQDPVNPNETVIVIRSIIPGGTADLEGTILPGDRLLKVNQIDVSRATLDQAVNFLKGAPNGPVLIEVAKPILLTGNGTLSHASEDTEDDQLTCLEDFQECIEDFQECLDSIHICIDGDDDLPFNHSPCTSTFEEYGRKLPKSKPNFFQEVNFLELGKEDQNFDSIETELTNFNKLNVGNSIANDSDVDLSYKSINETIIKVENKKNLDKNGTYRADSLTHSDKDGYDTCIEESFSDEVTTKIKITNTEQSNICQLETELHQRHECEDSNDIVKSTRQLLNRKEKAGVEKYVDDQNLYLIGNKVSDINGKAVGFVENVSLMDDSIDVIEEVKDTKKDELCINSIATSLTAVSEPCLSVKTANAKHICLDTKPMDVQLKSYDNSIGVLEEDEFFLVQYPSEGSIEVTKSYSEPNVLAEDSQNSQKFERSSKFKRRSYRKCLNEYYNDYQDCLEALGHLKPSRKESIDNSGQIAINLAEDDTASPAEQHKEELCDDDIFTNIVLPIKNRSAPDILDTSFVTMTYDPGPYLDVTRRKSAFVFGEQGYNETGDMTVIRPVDSESQPGYQFGNMLQKHWGSSHSVKVYREHGKSLGISIVGGKVDFTSTEKASDVFLGIFVKNVVPDSPAGKTGQFKTGDRILEVSGIDLRQATHETAVQAIRKADNPVTFVIQSLIPWKNDVAECNVAAVRRQSTKSRAAPPPPAKSPSVKRSSLKSPAPPPPVSSTSTENIPSLIFSKDSEINQNTQGISNHLSAEEESADQVPRQSPLANGTAPSISETLSEDDDQKNKNQTTAGSGSESDSDSDDDDVRELEGRTISAKGQQIDRASAANVKRSKEEAKADPEEEDDFGYTMNKVKKKYSNLGHTVLMVQLERGGSGLGLSLAGHKDRNCMAVFVCGLNPKGAAYKAGSIQVGDEILEVNGVVLHGRCHLNASAIIKGLSGPVFKVIILRRKTAIEDIAVKPITHFPISLSDEATEEHYASSYPNVRTVSVKKGTQSLGIMIIEGRHAEVGQGIFISDIQEDSAAEKAGLEIGEMILAVNKDTLVGSNYENAANLLKRSEGLVTLVVSNPSKKSSETPSGETGTTPATSIRSHSPGALKPPSAAGSKPPSRPTTPTPEPPADPATCPINPGKDTTVEISTDNKSLGIFFIGGKDTLINSIVLVEIYPGGTADKDGRLQPGDQILDVNGTSLKDVTHTTALQALRQTLPKMKLIVHRPSTQEYTPLDVELMKKPGKGLGISVVARKNGKGVYIADIISGGPADMDGKIAKGDLIISVNGQSVENSTGEEAGAILKLASGKVSLKLNRYKPVQR